MNPKQKMKICASILLAAMMVSMPLYILTATTFGSNGDYVTQPPVTTWVDPPELASAIVCTMVYPTTIQMTTNTFFDLENAIDLDQYFLDIENGSELSYELTYASEVLSLDLGDGFIRSVRSYAECGEYPVLVKASDGETSAFYNFTIIVCSPDPLVTDEDVESRAIMDDYAPYGTDHYELTASYGVDAVLETVYTEPTILSLSPLEDWYGNGNVILETYDTPFHIPIPIPVEQEQMYADITDGFTFGYFVFDFEVESVNDPPIACDVPIHQLTMTAGSRYDLNEDINLNGMFTDVDSEMSFSWSCDGGLVSAEMYGPDLRVLTSADRTGSGVLKLLADDGQYVAMQDIYYSIIPRGSVALQEDGADSLQLDDYVNTSTQDYWLAGSDNLGFVNQILEDGAVGTISPDSDWSGLEDISLSAQTMAASINPPTPPDTISSEPLGPSIPTIPGMIEFDHYEFDVSVSPVNDPPFIVTSPTVSTDEDSPMLSAFSVVECMADIDSELDYSLEVSADARVDASIDYAGNVNIYPEADWFGTGMVTVSASDGEFDMSVDVPVQVLPVNDIPQSDGVCSLSMEEDTELTINLSDYFTDVDDVLWFSFTTDDANSTSELNETTWNLTVLPGENWSGNITMDLYASDSDYQVSAAMALAVVPVNDRPEVLLQAPIVMLEGATLDLNLSDVIADIDSELEYFVYSTCGNMRCDRTGCTDLSLSARSSCWNGEDVVKVLASDGEFIVEANLDITVVPVNGPPETSHFPDGISLQEDGEFALTFGTLFSDPDGDALAYTFDSEEWLALDIDEETQVLTMTPQADRNGESVLTMSAYDGVSWTSIDLPVEVRAVNDAPVLLEAIPPVLLASGNGTVIGLFAYFSDADSQELTVEIEGAENASVSPVDVAGYFRIQTQESWEGSEDLIVRVSDGENVIESKFTVSAQKAAIDVPVTTADLSFSQSIVWMGLGMILAVALVAMYTGTRDLYSNTRTRANKGRVV